MIKVAFFDIDGTILKFGYKEPSDKVVYTLNSLKEKGILLCMATGRSYPTIPHFKNIKFDIYLTFNGSYVLNKETIIRKNPLDKKDVNIIIDNLNKMNRAISIANEKIVVCNGVDDDLRQYFAFGHEEPEIVSNFKDLCQDDVYQIMCSCHKEEYETILEGTSNSKIAAWWDKAVDIIPKSGGKGAAVKDILDYYGFSKKEAIAFGDGENDIEMFESVGTAIAMGNSNEIVKSKADEICLSVDDDGIYQYFKDHKII